MVRYSDTSFVGSLELEPHVEFLSPSGYRANETEFTRVWNGLTQRMIQEASSSTDATWSSAKYYAADAAALPDSQALYAGMQCTPDLSPSQCNLCLTKCLGNYQRCCLSRQGGSVVRLSCAFRAELYPFSGLFTVMTARPLSQSQPPLTMTESKKKSTGTIVAIVVPIVVVITFLVLLARRFSWRRKPYQETCLDQSGITTVHSLQFDFRTIEAATDRFSQTNKIGQGGFGEVYKGTLVGGTEVAVKRLSKTSEQGTQEFKNEVVLVAKLQHRSLVKLLVWKETKRSLFMNLSPTKA
ncbi:unnamed protein product [Microthlaspi erraticum]|uniref:Gnk2-homologous domain-containing protein n=1 Tax=Microthlaspi erraticum TaxID=1685480 RepID=A0A6D2JBS0_9BRAS|nr:unnamed protein product [Microthlaspi erraticum]